MIQIITTNFLKINNALYRSAKLVIKYPSNLKENKFKNLAEVIACWVRLNSLMLNSDETKLMLLGSKARLKNIADFTITINGCVINTCEQLKC